MVKGESVSYFFVLVLFIARYFTIFCFFFSRWLEESSRSWQLRAITT